MRGLLYIVVMIVVTGCSLSRVEPRELDEAQRIMVTDPAAALSRLNGVDVSQLDDSATLARWALLYSEAMVVNNLAAPTDTIVNIAIDYYGARNLNAELAKARQLKSLIRRDSASGDDLATALYIQKEKEFYLYRERMKRRTDMVVGLAVIIVAAGVIIWMRQRMKLQAAQHDALIAEASGLKSLIAEGRGEVGRLRSKLSGLLDNRFALIDSLCQTYYETQGTKAERKAIVDKVRTEIEATRNDSLPQMEEIVNDCRGNVLDKAREIYPEIKAEDYQLLVYLACGLSARTISLLLGESVEVVYKRKSRLKSRLKERAGTSEPDVMALF